MNLDFDIIFIYCLVFNVEEFLFIWVFNVREVIVFLFLSVLYWSDGIIIICFE